MITPYEKSKKDRGYRVPDDDYMTPQEREEFEREMEEMRKAAEVAERVENGM